MSIVDRVRQGVLVLTAASFSIAALLGIAVLVRGGDLDTLEASVLGTTVLVGVVSLAVLCYLAPRGRAQILGAVGGLVVLMPLVCGLMLIWGDPYAQEPYVDTLFSTAPVAALLAQACLLLAVVGGRGRRLIPAVVATLACGAAVVAMLQPYVWIDLFDPGAWYARLMGVLLILDVLGVVLVPALVLLRGVHHDPAGEAWRDVRGTEDDEAEGSRVLPADLWAEIEELSSRSGRRVEDVVREAVRRHEEDLDTAGCLSSR